MAEHSSKLGVGLCAAMAAATGLAIASQGCSRSGRAEGDDRLSTGLNALTDPSRQAAASVDSSATEADDAGTRQAADLLEQARRASQVSVDTGGPAPTANSQKPITTDEAFVASPPLLSEAQPEPVAAAVATPPATQSPEDRRRSLASELAGLIRAQGEDARSPAPTVARLAALEMIEPGISGESASGGPALTPAERRVLDAWRGMFVDARSKIESPGSDIMGLAEAMRTASENAGSVRPMRITRASLCTRVDGFGVYTELRKFGEQYKFLAGRRQRLVVYAEIEQFASRQRAAIEGGGPGFEVLLLQDLSLYHAGKDSDLLAWRKPDQEIVDVSRNRRKDFFVTQLIELPETLTVGSYRLKVRLTDRVGGATAESIIPIDVVADASAVRQ